MTIGGMMNMYCQKCEEQRNDIPVFLIKSQNLLFSYFAKWKCTARWYEASFFWKIFKKEIGAFLSGIARHNIASRQRYKRAMPTNIFSTYMQIYLKCICRYILNICKHTFNIYANILSTYIRKSKHLNS